MAIDTREKKIIGKFLKKIPVFRNLSDRKLSRLVNDFSIIHAESGKAIFFQTDKSTELYIVLNGRLRVTLLSESGEEFVLNELNEGDFFGELSLIDGQSRSATIIAQEDSSLGVLKREKFLEYVQKDPVIAIDLLIALAQRLRQATEREERFAFLDVRERLLRLLANIIENEGVDIGNGVCRIKKRTHRELAVRIGASREAITKILKELEQNRHITEQGKDVLISPGLFKPE
jgi:CRP/FNR family transcriptional regulator/CRP/FNR family cyclic AMP-dependent transcriptional regulator